MCVWGGGVERVQGVGGGRRGAVRNVRWKMKKSGHGVDVNGAVW